mmetsp:Transcript_82602/g.208380  ORF Transcript_82602/g.208380 Transcript_82602/m.208380 type:complete len:231 (-) Transcript_82602:353-1045(-)
MRDGRWVSIRALPGRAHAGTRLGQDKVVLQLLLQALQGPPLQVRARLEGAKVRLDAEHPDDVHVGVHPGRHRCVELAHDGLPGHDDGGPREHDDEHVRRHGRRRLHAPRHGDGLGGLNDGCCAVRRRRLHGRGGAQRHGRHLQRLPAGRAVQPRRLLRGAADARRRARHRGRGRLDGRLGRGGLHAHEWRRRQHEQRGRAPQEGAVGDSRVGQAGHAKRVWHLHGVHADA